MSALLLALVVELFVDWIPEQTHIEKFPFAYELQLALKEKDCTLQPWHKNPDDLWVFWNLGERVSLDELQGVPQNRRVLFTWEPPTVQPMLFDPKVLQLFGKVFTWDDDLVENRGFIKFFYPVLQPRMESVPSFEEKRFCTMIARRLSSKHPKQLYQEREKIIRFFENKPGEFDLYGAYWEKRKFKNWHGAISDKLSVLKGYKYCICYENMKDVRGYITEKIFDCFAAGVVPVYWGASNITDYIPPGCFIDRRCFQSNEKLYAFLKKISKPEYEAYLDSAMRFLQSEQAQKFSKEHFVKTVVKVLE